MPLESALKPRKMHYFKIVSSVFRALWWFPFLHFGWRARDERRKLCWADVGLASDPETDSEYLVWESERGSKIRTGQDGGHHRAFEAKAHTSNNKSRCPVGFYKAVRSYRSEAMLDAPFHHLTNHQRKPNHKVWYLDIPLGKNEIGNSSKTPLLQPNSMKQTRRRFLITPSEGPVLDDSSKQMFSQTSLHS